MATLLFPLMYTNPVVTLSIIQTNLHPNLTPIFISNSYSVIRYYPKSTSSRSCSENLILTDIASHLAIDPLINRRFLFPLFFIGKSPKLFMTHTTINILRLPDNRNSNKIHCFLTASLVSEVPINIKEHSSCLLVYQLFYGSYLSNPIINSIVEH